MRSVVDCDGCDWWGYGAGVPPTLEPHHDAPSPPYASSGARLGIADRRRDGRCHRRDRRRATPTTWSRRATSPATASTSASARPRRRWTPGCARSPFLAVGIYISGDSRGCRHQPNLTPKWVATQLRKGWRLLPITLGPQASCHPSFPRYDDDESIRRSPASTDRYPPARRQAHGRRPRPRSRPPGARHRRGQHALVRPRGLRRHQHRTAASRRSRFLSAWTDEAARPRLRLRRLLQRRVRHQDARRRPRRPARRVHPPRPDLDRPLGRQGQHQTDYIRDDGWLPGGRMKQYQGGHNETWGGVTINIDRNWLDLGRGSVADPVAHCKRRRRRPPDVQGAGAEGTTETALVKALQCLLKEQGSTAASTAGTTSRWCRGQGLAGATASPRPPPGRGALDEPARAVPSRC